MILRFLVLLFDIHYYALCSMLRAANAVSNNGPRTTENPFTVDHSSNIQASL